MNWDAIDQVEATPSPAQILSTLEPREFRHASCSQIKAFKSCNRRWYFASICGMAEKKSQALELGTKVHGELEAWLLHGTAPGEIAAAGVSRLPAPPVPPESVEQKFALVGEGFPVPLVGAIDLVERGRPTRITDHKTVSAKKHMKTPEQLKTDVQAIVYCSDMADVFGEPPVELHGSVYPRMRYAPRVSWDAVRFRHVYYFTAKGEDGAVKPHSEEVEVTLTGEELNAGMAEVKATLREMARVANVAMVDEAAPNASACFSYGRKCPFASLCELIGDVVIANPFKRAETVKALTAEAREEHGVPQTLDAAPVVATIPEPEPRPAPAPAPAPKPSKKSDPRIPDHADIPAQWRGHRFAQIDLGMASRVYVEIAASLRAAGFDVPATVPHTKRKELLASIGSICAIVNGGVSPLGTETEETPEAAPAPAPAPVPTKTAETTTPEPVAACEEVTQDEDGPDNDGGFPAEKTVLLVNCVSSQGCFTFDTLIRPLEARAAEALKVPHYLLADFSKGPNMVASLLWRGIRDGSIILPDWLAIDTGHPCADKCLPVLTEHFDVIVRGVR